MMMTKDHNVSGDVTADDIVFDLHHLDHPQRPTGWLLVIGLLAVALCAGLAYHAYGDAFSEEALTVLTWLYAAVAALWLLGKAVRRGPRNWLAPDGIFLLVFTLFHLPFVFLYLVGLADYTRDVFYSPSAVNRAMLCVILTGIFFVVGYELGPIGRRQPAHFAPAQRIPPLQFHAVQLVFVVSFVAALAAVVLGLGGAILAHGYGGFHRIERFVGAEASRWISFSLLSLRIGVTLYVAACIMRHGKIFKGIALPILLAIAVGFFLLLGGRSPAATMLIPMIIGYHYFVKRVRLRWGVPLLVGGLTLFGMIGVGRKAESLSVSAITQAYREYREETGVNPFVMFLAESGGSIKTVNIACAFIPSTENYWWGRSLVGSALMIIPSPVKGLRNEMVPSTWATWRGTGKVGGETAGWGSSIAMEAYMNFGLWGGSMFMVVVGFVIRRIYDTTLRRPTFLRVVLMLATVTGIALWCRNYSHHFFRPVAWTMLAAWLMWSPFGRRSSSVSTSLTPPRWSPET